MFLSLVNLNEIKSFERDVFYDDNSILNSSKSPEAGINLHKKDLYKILS